MTFIKTINVDEDTNALNNFFGGKRCKRLLLLRCRHVPSRSLDDTPVIPKDDLLISKLKSCEYYDHCMLADTVRCESMKQIDILYSVNSS